MAYLPLSTANLPNPVIDPAQGATADQHFDVGIWAGDGVNGRTIADLYGHTPDFVWIKNRTNAIDHNVADVLRGWKELYPNLTNAEGSQQMNAPTNDGLSGLPSSNGYNASGSNYVSWAWKANGSGVSNTAGSITSTVSANTTSGFSIVSYTGTGALGTVGHGLGATPELILIKSREDGTSNWAVYSATVGAAKNFFLNSLNDSDTDGAIFFNSTAPTSSVFTLGGAGAGQVNESAEKFIAYCFHSVEGFSKINSYVGDASSNSDSNFVYLGFRPAFVMIKADLNNSPWLMFDSTRKTYNVIGDEALAANSTEAEGLTTWNPNTSNSVIDFLSNGFKIRTQSTTGINGSQTHIYMAFAENPFKYSNAR